MTVTQKRPLYEAASLVSEAAGDDGMWKIKIISEGQGSSGFYSRELLEEYHGVFNDVLSFKNHPGEWDGPETRDFTMLAGEIVGETWVENDERGMAAVYGNYLPDPDHKDKLERYKKKLGVSIFAVGEGEFDESTGNFHIISFSEDAYTSVDVVIAPGARGGFMESMKKAYAHRAENASVDSADGTTEKEGLSEMAEKDVLEAVAKNTAAVEALTESNQTQAQATVDADAVEAAVAVRMASYLEAMTAIEAAELLPSQRKSLEALAATGADIASAIEDAKVVAAEARDAVKANESSTKVKTTTTTESAQFSESAGTEYKLQGFRGGK
jgi:hypothetical protein